MNAKSPYRFKAATQQVLFGESRFAPLLAALGDLPTRWQEPLNFFLQYALSRMSLLTILFAAQLLEKK